MLALNANRVTPIGQLIDAVWDISPPTTARGQIQICISALRKLFSDAGRPDAIRTYSPGYALEISPQELDSEEFAGLVTTARRQAEEGRSSEAAATLRTALALWRGPALAGVPADPVQRGAARLEESRLAAVEDRIRLDLALGRHEEIIGELRTLIGEHPLRERLYGFLMIALYRSGRQAEALEVCRRARTILVEELGIEPGRELQALEQAILNRDGALDLTRTADDKPAPVHTERTANEQRVVPRQLPASIADFTGRANHIGLIRQMLTDRLENVGAPYAVPIVAICGKGGVGKSSLAIRVAHMLSRGFPDGHLYGDFQRPGGDNRTGSILVRFLRALGVGGSALPEDAVEQAELYRTMLADKRLLVVLDDVESEEQVLPLLPGSPTCAVIVTSRVRLSGLFGAQIVDVDVFDDDVSIELLANIVGRERVTAEQEAAIELAGLCGGLPLALRITGARLASRPHWRIADLVRRLRSRNRMLDEFTHRGMELRSNIGLTYHGLSKQAKRLFRLFALIEAPDFPGWTAAALLDTDCHDAADVMESLIDAQLLDTVDYSGERTRYRFHQLIRAYATEQLMETDAPDERDAALARFLGAWMGLTEDAHRREYGGDFTVLHGSAPRWRPPNGDQLADLSNPIEWWDSERGALIAAIGQAASAGLDEFCWDLALTSVTLFEVRGYFDHWRETTELGLAVTERAGNRGGIAAMQYSLGALHMFQKRLSDARGCFAVAMEIFDDIADQHGRALVLRNFALLDGLSGNTTAMLVKHADALHLMRAVNDRMGEAQILRTMAKCWVDEGDLERARRTLDEALAICREVGCVRGEAQVLNQFAYLHLNTDQLELARQALHRVLLIVRDIGDRIGEAYALYGLGTVRYREGRPDGAETTLLHALSLAGRVGERLVEGQALYTLGEICLARGDNPAAVAHLSEGSRLFGELGSSLWHAKTLSLLSEAYAATGDVAGAVEKLERAADLLVGMDSGEAVRLLAQLEAIRSTLLATGPVARNAEPEHI